MNDKSADKRWCIEFWDHGQWNISIHGEPGFIGWQYKKLAVECCQQLNKDMPHEARMGAFDGHRYRVRLRGIL